MKDLDLLQRSCCVTDLDLLRRRCCVKDLDLLQRSCFVTGLDLMQRRCCVKYLNLLFMISAPRGTSDSKNTIISTSTSANSCTRIGEYMF